MPRQLDGPDGLHTESGITPEKSNSFSLVKLFLHILN